MVMGALIACGPAVLAALGQMKPISIERTYDMALVRRIVTDPAIWPHVHEDGTERDGWEPCASDEFMWMLASGSEPLGVFLVHARGVACFEMHTCILPHAWGEGAKQAAQELLRWAFTDGGCMKMVTNVPAYNRAALRFAKAGGMREEGINRASYLHAGQMIDQIMLGITKEEWLCQQQQS